MPAVQPILHRDFWKLASLLKEKGVTWGILGNPFHLNDEVCKRLYEHGCRKYQLSLDGMEQMHETFDNDIGRELLNKWGIPENFTARAFVLLGYCEGEYPKAKPRRDGRVVIVDEEV